VALTSADRSRPGGAAAFVVRHDCVPTTSPPLTATILTHTTRCPAGESILSPRAAAAATTTTQPHTPPGEAQVLLLLYVHRAGGLPPPVRANLFLAAPGDLVGEERAQ